MSLAALGSVVSAAHNRGGTHPPLLTIAVVARLPFAGALAALRGLHAS
jgi:hypothetical protein